MFEIGKFTRIKIQTMLGAGFVANMRLVGILDVFHRFAASWAGAISDGVIGFTDFGIARVEEFRHPFVFKLFGLA